MTTRVSVMLSGETAAEMAARLDELHAKLGATDDERHNAARNMIPCRICGAAIGEWCTYGLDKHPALRRQFTGRVHTRRLSMAAEAMP